MYLYGASGHAKVIIEILEQNMVTVDGLYDDNPDIKQLLGYRVYGSLSSKRIPKVPFIVSIGNNSLRKKIVEEYNLLFGNAFHLTSVISKRTKIDEGSVVLGNVVINSGALIGKHVILNTLCSIDHDCVIGDYVHISPNACLSGGVSIGEGTHIGSGSVIIPGISIGKWVTIGAGSVIISDVPDYATVVGNPGNVIKMSK